MYVGRERERNGKSRHGACLEIQRYSHPCQPCCQRQGCPGQLALGWNLKFAIYSSCSLRPVTSLSCSSISVKYKPCRGFVRIKRDNQDSYYPLYGKSHYFIFLFKMLVMVTEDKVNFLSFLAAVWRPSPGFLSGPLGGYQKIPLFHNFASQSLTVWCGADFTGLRFALPHVQRDGHGALLPELLWGWNAGFYGDVGCPDLTLTAEHDGHSLF